MRLALQKQRASGTSTKPSDCSAEQAKLDRVCHPGLSFYEHPNPDTCFKLADDIALCRTRKIVFGMK